MICEVCDKVEELNKEIKRLRAIICTFCEKHSWAAPAWRAQKEIKALFDEAKKRTETAK